MISSGSKYYDSYLKKIQEKILIHATHLSISWYHLDLGTSSVKT